MILMCENNTFRRDFQGNIFCRSYRFRKSYEIKKRLKCQLDILSEKVKIVKF